LFFQKKEKNKKLNKIKKKERKERKKKKRMSLSKPKGFKTKSTFYHYVLQRSKEWFELRKGRLSASQIGAAVGISKYTNPQSYFDYQVHPIDEFVSHPACEHGIRTEPLTVELIKKTIIPNLHRYFSAIKMARKSPQPTKEMIASWQEQVFSPEPGYHTPRPEHNPNFPDPEDADLFGLSPDMEGTIDFEIKNPFTINSYWNSYYRSIIPAYFAQVQWAMAMRCRKSMFFVVSSYTNESKPRLMAYNVWYVTFSEKFFKDFLYPKAKTMIKAIRNYKEGDTVDIEKEIPFLDEDGQYAASDEYAKLLSKYCTRIHDQRFSSVIQSSIKNARSSVVA
jgi:hypothetical protein